MLYIFKRPSQLRNYFNRDILFIRIFFIFFFIVLGLKIYSIKNYQEKFIDNIASFQPVSKDAQLAIAKQIPIDTKIYLLAIDDVNYKAKTVSVSFGVSIYFPEDKFKEDPKFDVKNGLIKNVDVVRRTVKNGIVEKYMVVDADIDAIYLMQSYPLDKQITYISLTAFNDVDSNYYFNISDFVDYTNLGKKDYKLVASGYVNQIDQRTISLGYQSHVYYAERGNAYFILDHKNIYVYLKTIQYVLLSVLTALLALLLSSKQSSPINGRVAVTGSSVFSLVASVFQINATMKMVSDITLFDIITMFAGLVIILSFTTTIRSLRVLDKHGLEESQAFDRRAFISMFMYVLIFFVALYIYM